MGEIADLYKELNSDRNDALEVARQLEPLTAYVGAGDKRPSAEQRPYTSIGRRGIASMTSTVHSSLFPDGVRWYRLEPPGGAGDEQASEVMDWAERKALDGLQAKHYGAIAVRAIRSALVGGICLVHNAAARIRLFPIRKFVLERTDDQVVRIVVEEERRKTPTDDSGGLLKRKHKLYTLIDYERNIVRQEREDGAAVSQVKDTPESRPEHWFVVEATEPEDDGYPLPYAWYVEPDIATSDVLCESLDQIAQLAAKQHPIIDPSSPIDPVKFTKAKSGQAFSGSPSDIGWSSAGAKLGDVGLITKELDRVNQTVERLMLMTLPDLARETTTATAAVLIARALDTLLHGTHSRLSDTLQLGLIQSELSHQARNIDGFDRLKPVIVTGAAAFTREADFDRTLNMAERLARLWPNVLQRIDDEEMLSRGLNLVNSDTDGLIRPPQQQQQPATPPSTPASSPTSEVPTP